MIDFRKEQVLPLKAAAKKVPARRKGGRTHVGTMYRWGSIGFRGIVLETIQIGGTRCTSVEALGRFFAKLSDATAPASERSNCEFRGREKAVRDADALLDREGF